MSPDQTKAPTVKIYLAFLAIYFVWGSVYLATRFMVDTLPPLLAAGVRFSVAGAILFGWTRFKGFPLPKGTEWKGPLVVAVFLLAGTNGSTCWASQVLPSGIVALMQGAVPLWIVVLNVFWFHQERCGWKQVGAIVMGIVGMGLLILSKEGSAFSFSFDPRGIAVALLGSFLWSSGSLLSRTVPSPGSHAVASGCAMIIGGIILFGVGGLMGEWGCLEIQNVSTASLLALAYLITFGSLVAFCSYTWLIKVERPTKVATCTFVNPLVAVFLGWCLAGERLSPQDMLGGIVILASIFLLWKPEKEPEPTAARVAIPRGSKRRYRVQ